MAIPITCASCGKSFRVKNEFAGRRGRCPWCSQAVHVPGELQRQSRVAPQDVAVATGSKPPREPSAPAEAPPERDARALMREILAAFQGEFPRVRPTLLYRFGVIIVAGTMLLLPAVYVALVGLAAYGVYYHAVYNIWILRSGLRWFALLLYLVPLFAGLILLPFLIKPLFARPSSKRKQRELKFTDEPLVHSFVQRLCQAVNAPVPRSIHVDCAVNAGAGFRGGIFSMLSRDLVLTIGLPLVAGMNMRQLAGVLAHELGHFSQGAGMRVQYLVRAVNGWFYRVVYEEDQWDDLLDSLTDDEEWGFFALVGLLAKLLVGISRRILWLLMLIGHAVSCFMSRQMEFDADRYEARLAGSDAFKGTTKRMHELLVADRYARHLLVEDAYGGPLPKDFPTFIAQTTGELPPPARQLIREVLKEKRARWFATHPADKDRIAAAQRENAPGIFRLELPATLLFSDFEELAAAVSPKLYRRALAMTALPGGTQYSNTPATA